MTENAEGDPRGEQNTIFGNNIKSFLKYKTCLGYVPISFSALWPLGDAYIPILLSQVEQEQRPSGNADREVIVVGAGIYDGEGERA